MENFTEQQKFDNLLTELNKDLICGLSVGAKITDSILYKYEASEKVEGSDNYTIGKFNGYSVAIDPHLKYADLRVFDTEGNVLIDLANFGFHSSTML